MWPKSEEEFKDIAKLAGQERVEQYRVSRAGAVIGRVVVIGSKGPAHGVDGAFGFRFQVAQVRRGI